MDTTKTTLGRAEVFSFMETHGIARIAVEFSGGGDEGHITGIRLFDAEDRVMEIEEKWPHAHMAYGWEEDYNGEASFGPGAWIISDKKMTKTREVRGEVKEYEVPVYREANDYEIRMSQLENAISQPVFDKYGSFAGEFSVNGEVIWALEERRCYMEGDESSYEGFYEEV